MRREEGGNFVSRPTHSGFTRRSSIALIVVTFCLLAQRQRMIFAGDPPPPVVVVPPMEPSPVLVDPAPGQGEIAREIGDVFGSPVLRGPTRVDRPEPRQTEGEGGVLPHTFPGASVGTEFPRSY